jgi:RimJ/RimL family protein N-acetyltransferase
MRCIRNRGKSSPLRAGQAHIALPLALAAQVHPPEEYMNLETTRLILRPMTRDDTTFAWSLWGDRETGKYLRDPYYESAEVLGNLFSDIEAWTDFPFVAVLKADGCSVGLCSVGEEGSPDEWGFGYSVKKEYWGNGYAPEMVNALIRFARERGIRRFTAEVAVENAASCRVMEKCGLSVARQSSFAKLDTDVVYPSYIFKLTID